MKSQMFKVMQIELDSNEFEHVCDKHALFQRIVRRKLGRFEDASVVEFDDSDLFYIEVTLLDDSAEVRARIENAIKEAIDEC